MEFCRQSRESATAALATQRGALVPPRDVIDLHSEALCEDGRTILRLYDLRDGGTGSQCFANGEEPGPICYC